MSDEQHVALAAGLDIANGRDVTMWVVLCTTVSGGEVHRMVAGVFTTKAKAETYMRECLPHAEAEMDSVTLDEGRS